MVREDLIASAVSFLQDPSVASAPIEKRVAFLQSKNLTQEEVDLALARAGGGNDAPSNPTPATSVPVQTSQAQYASRQPQPHSPYGPGYWQPPPPEVPKRDWRDWFIMATVVGGVSYGLYVTAKRYLVPLIAPPTPPQLTSDKNDLDSSLEHIHKLLDQLSADTATLKSAEGTRTSRLDTALTEVEAVLAAVKDAGKAREDDARRLADDVRGLRDLVPLAIERNKEGQENRLRELGNEVRGLRTLVGNRFGGGASVVGGAAGGQQQGRSSATGSGTVLGTGQPINGTTASAGAGGGSVDAPADGMSPALAAHGPSSQGDDATTQSTGQTTGSSNPYGRLTNGKAAIPAWQLAAAKKGKAEEANKDESVESPSS